jgi:hypothetical protein
VFKSFLAAPALYVSVFAAVRDARQGYFVGGLRPVFVIAFALTWPLAYLVVRIARSPPPRDPGAPPTCPNCDYDLTGDVNGIRPECGKPIEKPDL